MESFSIPHVIVLLVVVLVFAAVVVLFIRAVMGIINSRGTGVEKAVWILIVLAFPILGPIIWLVTNKNGSTTT